MTNPTPLSPAAQAVLDALDDQFYELNSQHIAAAVGALRAASDQVVPSDPNMPERWEVKDEIRAELLAIATELENQ